MIFKKEFIMDNILNKSKNIYFIGIGGISMSSIAFVLKHTGYNVSGSDMYASAKTDELIKAGINVNIGHSPANITEDLDLVIFTADVKDDNPELIRARELDIPCLVRAQALGLMMKSYITPIGVSGTHGKSTTTSMLSDIFTVSNADPTVLSGAELATNNGAAYRLGAENYFIFEACEYTESFLSFFPKIALVLNVEEDHLDYFKDIYAIKQAFAKFVDLCGDDGIAVVNADCQNTMDAVKDYKGTVITYGVENDADFTSRNLKFDHGRPNFDVYFKGDFYARLSMSVFGKHNVSNALAAIATAYSCKLPIATTVEALNKFCGARRRFELVGKYNGADIVSDYAHHPTEIETTLKAAMEIGYDKVTCIFQPHTFTRTYAFFDDFVRSLSICDKTVLAPVYAKRDKNVYNVDSSTIASKIDGAEVLADLSAAVDYIKSNAKENELYILMGAGDINTVANKL